MESLLPRASSHIAKDLLSRAHPSDTASAIFTDKVLHKSLFLRPTSPDPTSQDARAKRRLERLRKVEKKKRREKPKRLSAKEKRMSGIHDIPKDEQKHAIYVPLNQMWVAYMWEVLGIEEGTRPYLTAQGAGSKLASADYHGAELTVVKSRCVGMVGLKGIVVKDTKFTFQVISKGNELKTIPKKHTVFGFEIPQPSLSPEGKLEESGNTKEPARIKPVPLRFELHGSQFEHRATDRATKKFKQRHMLEL